VRPPKIGHAGKEADEVGPQVSRSEPQASEGHQTRSDPQVSRSEPEASEAIG
jgi:hypothetical protein